MKTNFIFVTILFFAAIISGFSQQQPDKFFDLNLNQKAAVNTVAGFTLLHSSFGPKEQYFALLRISGLKPGVKYEATFTFEGGTGINYGMSWAGGNPLAGSWYNFIGLGTGTGSGKIMPGYETKQLFIVDSKSTENQICLVVRSDKPWVFDFSLSVANPAVNRDMKNKYGYYMVDDLTYDGRTTFLLAPR
jgi:hypothetical protein